MTQQSIVYKWNICSSKMKQMKMLETKTKHIFILINESKTFKSERNADSVKIYKNNLKQKMS